MPNERHNLHDGMQLLGNRIRAKRRAAELSQEDVANALECSVSYISKLESGRATCTVQRVMELADLFHCDIAELIAGTNPGSPVYADEEFANLCRKLTPRGRCLALEILQNLADHEV